MSHSLSSRFKMQKLRNQNAAEIGTEKEEGRGLRKQHLGVLSRGYVENEVKVFSAKSSQGPKRDGENQRKKKNSGGLKRRVEGVIGHSEDEDRGDETERLDGGGTGEN